MYKQGIHSLSRLPQIVGTKLFVSNFVPMLDRHMKGSAWQEPHAALMSLTQVPECCDGQLNKHIAKFLGDAINFIKSGKNTHPRVVWAALHAIASIGNESPPRITRRFSDIVEACADLLDTSVNARVVDAACWGCVHVILCLISVRVCFVLLSSSSVAVALGGLHSSRTFMTRSWLSLSSLVEVFKSQTSDEADSGLRAAAASQASEQEEKGASNASTHCRTVVAKYREQILNNVSSLIQTPSLDIQINAFPVLAVVAIVSERDFMYVSYLSLRLGSMSTFLSRAVHLA